MLGRGVLPSWAPFGVVTGSLVLVAAALATTGRLGVVLLVVGTAVVPRPACTPGRARSRAAGAATDRIATFSLCAAFALAVTPLVSLLYQVVKRGSARFDGDFFTESARGVIGAGGGASHAIIGTLVITGCATLISVPIGIMAAVYLNEYGTGRLKRAITFFVDVMTGIPSIVAGLFAYALFQLIFGPGVRLGIMGAVALSVLMIPIVVRASEEMLKIVPTTCARRPTRSALPSGG